MFWRARHLKTRCQTPCLLFLGHFLKNKPFKCVPNSSFYFYLSLSFLPRCQMCSNGLRLTFIYNESKWLWKKSIIVFIPYNFKGKQTNVFFPTALIFLNLYFTNHRIHSVILLLSCRKLKLIILETKLLIPYPSPEALFKASSSLLTKGSEFPGLFVTSCIFPRKQGDTLSWTAHRHRPKSPSRIYCPP